MNPPARWPSGLLLFSLSHACHTGHAYYVLVFASGRGSGRPRHSHAFATFVRSWGEGPHQASWSLEAQTISWLPRGLEVDPGRALPEPGTNLDLHETLAHVFARGQRVSLWGPYAAEAVLYERAVRQARRLAGGSVRYKALDHGLPAGRVSNAVHAVSDLAEEAPRLQVATASVGEPAGGLIARHLRPWLLQPDEVHPWLEERLGLEDYPLVRRNLGRSPRRRAVG
jgi:hypothetical protein